MDAYIPDAHRIAHRTLNQHLDIDACSISVRYFQLDDERTSLVIPDFEDATRELGYTDRLDIGIFRRYLEAIARFGGMTVGAVTA